MPGGTAIATRARTRPRVPAISPRAAGCVATAGLAVAVVALVVRYPTSPQYDSSTSLLWGREILSGELPGFDGYRAPTEHPLLLAVSVLLAPLRETGGTVLVGICGLSVVALAVAVFRLGRAAAGLVGGVIAAALILSRLNLWLLAWIGFVDLPYIALVGWAAALEAERPRRGGAVWVLLALAGLLRPEAWLLAALYALYVGWPRRARGIARAALRAAAAPVIWMATDLIVTGHPLFSLQHTDSLALELQRERPLGELPGLMLHLLQEVVKLPVLLAGAAGAVLAIRLRRGELRVPLVLVVATCATYLVIATGGLPNVYRYLLNAGTGIVILAAFAFAGWSTLHRDNVWRVRWAVPAILALVLGAAWTVARTSPAKARSVLQQRLDLRHDLEQALALPAARRARACGPISVPNHKLVADVRTILDLPDGAVVARSNRSLPPQRRGLALVIDRRIERLPALDIYEVPKDGGALLQLPPPGFELLGGNRSFAVYGAC
jgi:hypothetical protein